jgi:hypothetical protein
MRAVSGAKNRAGDGGDYRLGARKRPLHWPPSHRCRVFAATGRWIELRRRFMQGILQPGAGIDRAKKDGGKVSGLDYGFRRLRDWAPLLA